SSSPLTNAASATVGFIRMTSPWSPSSRKKPFFSAKARGANWALSSGTPILILSAAWADAWRIQMLSKARKIFFIRHLRCSALLSSAYPKLLLRLFQNRQIRYLAESNLTLHLADSFSLLNHETEPLFG